jgi:hypothetical protein
VAESTSASVQRRWSRESVNCGGCQRMTASAFSTSLTYPMDAFEPTEGQTVLGGLHIDEAQHHPLRLVQELDVPRLRPESNAINVRATLLDDAGWFVSDIERRLPAKLLRARAAVRHSFEPFPGRISPADGVLRRGTCSRVERRKCGPTMSFKLKMLVAATIQGFPRHCA